MKTNRSREIKTSVGAAAAAITLFASQAVHAQGCVGDVAVDGRVDGGDLGVLLANWGPVTSTALSRACDFDNSGQVDGADLGGLLAGWGACPPAVPAWATLIEALPDPAVVTDQALRAAITATGLAWRVRDTATQIEMLLVPPGTFQMGCVMASDAHGCPYWELPVHTVVLPGAYYLGRYEVTQAQWNARMAINPSRFQAGADFLVRPVEQASPAAISSYLGLTGLRLPTEAEWENACRAGTQTPFYNGTTDDSTVSGLAWFAPNSDGQTHAVGGRVPNGLGFYDMMGNVWEWVSDLWGDYPAVTQINPQGPTSGSDRVVRGGSWRYALTDALRSSGRGLVPPNLVGDDVGFRVARKP